ncbi:MAG: AAA family ATPase, partial [Candidatus Thermoplasmatota archaeon]|nr:AAA family ATPase [Candidatus Thermoplasmatota archaeon]
RIDITYKEKKTTEMVTVPRNDGSFTFQFDVNEKTYQIGGEPEERPYIKEAIGLVLVVVMLIGLFFLAARVRSIREAINEKRRKGRKKVEKEEKDRWYEKLIMDEELKERVVRCGGVLLLSLLGLFWAPFYPWWMVLIFAAFLTAVAYKYPYISMLVMTVLVTAAASYQSREFGWVFLLFSLVVMIGGFFDWRYAYLSYLTIFAAGYGLGFAVPMIAAVAFSLFLGTVVLITAGIFLLVVAPSGTFQWFSFLAVPSHEKSFVQFDRGVDPNWSPIDLVNSITDLTTVDTNILSTVLQETMGYLVPLFGLIGWGLAMVAVYLIFKRWLKGETVLDRDPGKWAMRMVPALILMIFGVVSILWAEVEFSIWLLFPFLAIIPASLIAFGVRGLGEEALPMEYGVSEIRSSDVGKKISEMVGFRKATFKDIGGLEDVKREVKNALMLPLLEPEMATRYGVKPSKGILLFGPPGCGKTLMLRAVASDLNVEMIGIKCSDVMSKWYGESEGLISSLFEEARARSPCILFLDEIDAIAKRRDFYSTDDVTPRVLSIMLSEMDGMDEAEGIIIVATTNMPDLVDPALMRPGRFDKVIYIPPPDERSREEIVKVHLKGKFVSNDIDTGVLAKSTRGFSGADIANLVREASSFGLERALETRKPQPITMQDMMKVLDEIKPSISPKMIRMYDKLRNEYERKRKNTDKEKVEDPDEGMDGPLKISARKKKIGRVGDEKEQPEGTDHWEEE